MPRPTNAQLLTQLEAAQAANADLQAQLEAAKAAPTPTPSAAPIAAQMLSGLIKPGKQLSGDGEALCLTGWLEHASPARKDQAGSITRPRVELPSDRLIANGDAAQLLAAIFASGGWVYGRVSGYWRPGSKPEPYQGKDGRTYYRAIRELEVLGIEVIKSQHPINLEAEPAAEPFSAEPTLEQLAF